MWQRAGRRTGCPRFRCCPGGPGTVRLTGDLKQPKEITLAALPQQTAQVSFGSGKGPRQLTEAGSALADVLPLAGLATGDAKHDELAFAVLAVGADGYGAAVAYGPATAAIKAQASYWTDSASTFTP